MKRQSSEPDSDITGMLESSDQEFKIMTNMLKTLMEKVHDVPERRGNISIDGNFKNFKMVEMESHNRKEDCL